MALTAWDTALSTTELMEAIIASFIPCPNERAGGPMASCRAFFAGLLLSWKSTDTNAVGGKVMGTGCVPTGISSLPFAAICKEGPPHLITLSLSLEPQPSAKMATAVIRQQIFGIGV